MREALEKLTQKLDLPEDLLEGAGRLTLTGGNRVRIENYRCVLEFTAELLEVRCGKQQLRVRGDGLRMLSMDRWELLLTGRVLSVEVENAR